MFKIIFVFLIFQSSLFAASLLETFDVKSYSPIKKGMRDVYFEVRNNKLKTMIESSTGVKLTDEPYFKVFWKFPSEVDIHINGMPKGFIELEQNLKKIGIEVVDYVIPRSPKEVFKDFNFTEESLILKGKSKNAESRVSEVTLNFDKNGLLNNMLTLSPYSRSETEFKYSVKKNSDNKYLTDELTTIITRGKVKLNLTKSFDYISKEGYVLPSVVKVSMHPVDKKSKSQGNLSEMQISNYKINEGVAAKNFGKNSN